MKHFVLLAALAVSGCAGYSIQEGGNGSGYDVYRPDPYLQGDPIVDANDATKVTGYKFTLVWLPNYSKRYRVRSWAGFGKADFTFKFANGWQLTEITDSSSNVNVLSELTGLLTKVLPLKMAGTNAGDEGPKTAPPPEPLLYKIDMDDCTGDVCLRKVGIGPPTCMRPGPAK